MVFTIEILGYGLLIPAAIATVLALVLSRGPEHGRRQAYALAAALAAAVAVGTALFPWVPPLPASPWHWLAHLVWPAVFVGGVATAEGLRSVERAGVFMLLSLAAVTLLLPDFPELAPRRTWWVAATAVCGGGGMWLAEFGARTAADRWTSVAWLLAALAAAALLALSGSTKFARLALLLAAAQGGTLSVARVHLVLPLAGAAPLQMMYLGGLLLSGFWYSFSGIPLACYLLVISAVPAQAVVWLPPLAARSAGVRLAVRGVVVMTVLAASVSWAASAVG